MQFAVSIPNMEDAGRLVRLAIAAEDAGWDGVFLWDHMHFVRSLGLDVFDPWVTLGAIANATERVRLGTMVTPVARRRPWKLAKEIVTLDHLSHGRVVLGVGLGEPIPDEFGTFGEPTDSRERAAILDEGLALLDRFLRGEAVHHDGHRFQIDAHLRPAAVQRPRPPIWVAGKWPNPKPIERAARWEGVVPISAKAGPPSPEEVAAVAFALTRDGYDVVATAAPDIPASEYEDAGATWFVQSGWPAWEGWLDDLERHVRDGPPAR